MPNILGTVASSSFTHTGNMRCKNEDALLSLPIAGLWAIADGLGEHDSGEFASHCVISHLHKLASTHPRGTLVDFIPDVLQAANTEIFQRASSENRVIGSTAVVLVVAGETYHCFWCGDSRCYLSREHQLDCITKDHTEAEAGRYHHNPEKHTKKQIGKDALTHALGVDRVATIDSVMGYINEDDRFLLCSDGLTKVFNHIQLANRVKSGDVDQVNLDFLSDAMLAGAPYNLSSVLVSF